VKMARLEDMIGGWFVGNFEPSILASSVAEVCVKSYETGEREEEHYQREACEVTCIVSGRVLLAGVELVAGDIMLIEPGESASFEALEPSTLVAFKTPSVPEDKVVGGGEVRLV